MNVRVKPLAPAAMRREAGAAPRDDEADDSTANGETMAERETETVGMRAVFWTWMGIVVVGLAVMIAIPLGGR